MKEAVVQCMYRKHQGCCCLNEKMNISMYKAVFFGLIRSSYETVGPTDEVEWAAAEATGCGGGARAPPPLAPLKALG